MPTDPELPVVSGMLGQASGLAAGGAGVPHELADGVSLGADGRGLGAVSPQPGWDRSHRRGRGAMAERTPLPDAGVPDRRELPAPAAHRAGTNGAKPVELFPHAGQDAIGNLEVRV